MGGLGSGRWRKHQCKRLVENTLKISIHQWIQSGKIVPGTEFEWNWLNESNEVVAQVGVRVKRHQLEIYYDLGDEAVVNYIILGQTDNSFGGYRTWFICPECECHVADLYFVKTYFLCRHCNRLGYSSQRR